MKVVLVADPSTKTVSAHRRGTAVEVFSEDDTITVPDVLANFILPVEDAFRLLAAPATIHLDGEHR